MKLLIIVGTQLRHQYFLSKLVKNFNTVGIIEFKRTLVAPPKIDNSVFSSEDLKIEEAHLEKLQNKEKEYFLKEVMTLDKTNYTIKTVSTTEELNSKEIVDWVKKLDCDVMLDYGSGILSNSFLDVLPDWKINLHGGLSPYYKGSATLLWPFYMQQPELAGATFHLLSKKIDAGDIIHHSRPVMYENDSVSDIGCRTIIQASSDIIKILNKLDKEKELLLYSQKTGKLFLEKDYKPSIIRVVNDLFNRGMIKEYILNKPQIDSQYTFYSQV